MADLGGGARRLPEDSFVDLARASDEELAGTGKSRMFFPLRGGVEFFADEEELGPWQTIYYRYNRWRKEGLWQQRYAKRFGASGEALDSRFEARVSL